MKVIEGSGKKQLPRPIRHFSDFNKQSVIVTESWKL
jgi:hypothetical protein